MLLFSRKKLIPIKEYETKYFFQFADKSKIINEK